jgi:hypothetical protein
MAAIRFFASNIVSQCLANLTLGRVYILGLYASGLVLDGLETSGIIADGCSFHDCSFRNIRISKSTFSGSRFRSSNFVGAHIASTSFYECQFDKTDIAVCNLESVTVDSLTMLSSDEVFQSEAAMRTRLDDTYTERGGRSMADVVGSAMALLERMSAATNEPQVGSQDLDQSAALDEPS